MSIHNFGFRSLGFIIESNGEARRRPVKNAGVLAVDFFPVRGTLRRIIACRLNCGIRIGEAQFLSLDSEKAIQPCLSNVEKAHPLKPPMFDSLYRCSCDAKTWKAMGNLKSYFQMKELDIKNLIEPLKLLSPWMKSGEGCIPICANLCPYVPAWANIEVCQLCRERQPLWNSHDSWWPDTKSSITEACVCPKSPTSMFNLAFVQIRSKTWHYRSTMFFMLMRCFHASPAAFFFTSFPSVSKSGGSSLFNNYGLDTSRFH